MKTLRLPPAFCLAVLLANVAAGAAETGPQLGLQTRTCRNMAIETDSNEFAANPAPFVQEARVYFEAQLARK